MITCPGCRQNLKFDIASQEMVCAYCDSHYDPYEVEKDVDAKGTEYFETTVFTCPQCGGELYSTENEATAFCIYCGGANILTERISQEKRPNYIIPFQKTKEDCKEAYIKKMRKAIYAPKAYKSPEFIESFRGIYMPYWSYQMKQDKHISVMGVKQYRSGDYIIKDYKKLSGDLDVTVDGIPYDASTSFYDDISQGLGTYDCRDQRVFSTSFLSGFYADIADVDSDLYEDEAKNVVTEATMKKIKEEKMFQKMEFVEKESVVKNAIHTDVVRIDRTMYPVWFMTYRNKDRVAYATVNGQTGKVSADIPVDKGKFLLGTLITAIPIFVIFNLLITLNPKECLAVCTLFLIISAVLYWNELGAIYKKEQFINDKAQLELSRRMAQYQNSTITEKIVGKLKGDWKSFRKDVMPILLASFFIGAPFYKALGFLVWPLIVVTTIMLVSGIIEERAMLECPTSVLPAILAMGVVMFAALVRLLNPVNDAWYYGMSIFTLLTVCVNFLECINHYNYLAMRKLPQFDRRGGDDIA